MATPAIQTDFQLIFWLASVCFLVLVIPVVALIVSWASQRSRPLLPASYVRMKLICLTSMAAFGFIDIILILIAFSQGTPDFDIKIAVLICSMMIMISSVILAWIPSVYLNPAAQGCDEKLLLMDDTDLYNWDAWGFDSDILLCS